MMMNSVCFYQALLREASTSCVRGAVQDDLRQHDGYTRRRRDGLCLFVAAVMQTGVFADAVAAVHVMIDATAGAA